MSKDSDVKSRFFQSPPVSCAVDCRLSRGSYPIGVNRNFHFYTSLPEWWNPPGNKTWSLDVILVSKSDVCG